LYVQNNPFSEVMRAVAVVVAVAVKVVARHSLVG
jgi:hypothetical protein